MSYDCYCDFDLEQHKKTYLNYLEVLVLPDGKVEYAVPSHQEKALALAAEKLGLSRQEVIDLCPQEYYGDYLSWLLTVSGSISLWFDFYMKGFDKPTREQIETIKKLKENKVYVGDIPSI